MARRLGQILVDMGYLDEDKLWAVLEGVATEEEEGRGFARVRQSSAELHQRMRGGKQRRGERDTRGAHRPNGGEQIVRLHTLPQEGDPHATATQ